MHRLPLADQLPYESFPPKPQRFWLAVGRLYWRNVLLRRNQRVLEIEFQGVERLAPLLNRGSGVLIAPNHSDHADAGILLELGRRVKTPLHFMAAYQLFRSRGGLAKFLLPRIGAFPVDREGSDLTSFKTAVDILGRGKPLVIFPEGEIYYTNDRITPLREGALAVAAAAAKRMPDDGQTVWLVPAAMKYRFLDGHDPTPALVELMDRLERKFTWWPRNECSLVERILAYAEGVLGLKELEYLGASRSGPIKPRIESLRDAILDDVEDRRLGKRQSDSVPVRVKELRRACLDALADPETTPELAEQIRGDLNDLFVVAQMFSYPGDYVLESPTLERVAETLLKLEQDLLGQDEAYPKGPRRAIVSLGEPIDVRARLSEFPKSRLAVSALTVELERRIQSLLDEIGPGRPLPDASKALAKLAPRIRAASADR